MPLPPLSLIPGAVPGVSSSYRKAGTNYIGGLPSDEAPTDPQANYAQGAGPTVPITQKAPLRSAVQTGADAGAGLTGVMTIGSGQPQPGQRRRPSYSLPPIASGGQNYYPNTAADGIDMPGMSLPPMPARKGQRGSNTPVVVPDESLPSNMASKGAKIKAANTTSVNETGLAKGPGELAVRPKTGQVQLLTKPNAVVRNPHPDPVKIYPTDEQGNVQPITGKNNGMAWDGARLSGKGKMMPGINALHANRAVQARLNAQNAWNPGLAGPSIVPQSRGNLQTQSIQALGNIPNGQSVFHERMLRQYFDPSTNKFTGPLAKFNTERGGHAHIGQGLNGIKEMYAQLPPEDQQKYDASARGQAVQLPAMNDALAPRPTAQQPGSHSWTGTGPAADKLPGQPETAPINVEEGAVWRPGAREYMQRLAQTRSGEVAENPETGQRQIVGSRYGTGSSGITKVKPTMTPAQEAAPQSNAEKAAMADIDRKNAAIDAAEKNQPAATSPAQTPAPAPPPTPAQKVAKITSEPAQPTDIGVSGKISNALGTEASNMRANILGSGADVADWMFGEQGLKPPSNLPKPVSTKTRNLPPIAPMVADEPGQAVSTPDTKDPAMDLSMRNPVNQMARGGTLPGKKLPALAHMEPDADDMGGKSDNDADDMPMPKRRRRQLPPLHIHIH